MFDTINPVKSKMPGKIKQLPWSHIQEECLLELVIAAGLHLVSGTKGINEKWEELYKDLFENEEFSSYKGEHYKEGGSRKIRDKYIAIVSAIQRDIEIGNQSGKEGDLSKRLVVSNSLLFIYLYYFTRYKLVKQIKLEIDEADELKLSEAEVKRKTQDVEDQILSGTAASIKKAKKSKPAQGWGVRKDINGLVTGEDLSRSSSSSKTDSTVKSLDEALLEYLNAKPKDNVKFSATCHEELIEEQMTLWAELHYKDVYQVLYFLVTLFISLLRMFLLIF